MDMNIIKLNVHNDQEAFDKAVRHLKGMRQRAVLGNQCIYETEDGKNNCVVGAMLVLDTPAKHRWARKIVAGIKNLVREPHTADDRAYRIDQNGVSPELLAELQFIHDDYAAWDADGFKNWPRLRSAAENWGLNTKALDALGV